MNYATLTLTSAEITRLEKLAGMLGSSSDGERLNALGMIEKMAKGHGLRIDELLLRPKAAKAEPRPEPRSRPWAADPKAYAADDIKGWSHHSGPGYSSYHFDGEADDLSDLMRDLRERMGDAIRDEERRRQERQRPPRPPVDLPDDWIDRVDWGLRAMNLSSAISSLSADVRIALSLAIGALAISEEQKAAVAEFLRQNPAPPEPRPREYGWRSKAIKMWTRPGSLSARELEELSRIIRVSDPGDSSVAFVLSLWDQVGG